MYVRICMSSRPRSTCKGMRGYTGNPKFKSQWDGAKCMLSLFIVLPIKEMN